MFSVPTMACQLNNGRSIVRKASLRCEILTPVGGRSKLYRIQYSLVFAIHSDLSAEMLCDRITRKYNVDNLGWTCHTVWKQAKRSGCKVPTESLQSCPILLLHDAIVLTKTTMKSPNQTCKTARRSSMELVLLQILQRTG